MRFCSYVVKDDTGFAPNPFGGYCTLAACTPNHQGLRLEPGDWVVGTSAVAAGNRLIYAMRISEVLGFDDYYRDSRFAAKKPRAGGWQDQCGGNIYFRDAAGQWVQGLAFHHTRPDDIRKDTRHPRAFISDHFFYFAEKPPPFPGRYAALIQTRQGCRCSHEPKTVRAFVKWLEKTYSPGKHAEPRDRDKAGGEGVTLGLGTTTPRQSRSTQWNRRRLRRRGSSCR